MPLCTESVYSVSASISGVASNCARPPAIAVDDDVAGCGRVGSGLGPAFLIDLPGLAASHLRRRVRHGWTPTPARAHASFP